MPDRSLNAFRREYLNGKLHERDLLEDPFLQFMEWMEDASRSGISEPNAMSLATADISGKPTVRIVLLKDARPDGFVFYTNYESSKARALEENPQASILFFWPELERQVRIEGKVDKISSEESDEFFRARPLESRVASIVSEQSREIPDRDELIRKIEEHKASRDDHSLTRPGHWGGYILKPASYEFWQGRENRLNDRLQYFLSKGCWKVRRLAP